jgi:hypothetical protein
VRNNRNYTNTRRLNGVYCSLQNDQWVTAEIVEENYEILESNQNENITYQNLWDTVKSTLRGNFREISNI